MAFLDQTDTIERLYSLLPRGWFPDLVDAPNLNGVLAMLAAAYSYDERGLYQFIQYVREQSRIFTATDFWLDLAAADYFGSMMQRHTDESDASFRRRIIINLLAPRGTRPALQANVANLTGFEPKIIELRNPGDCGSYTSAANPTWGGAVYNQMGAYGTFLMPFQLLINVTRPRGEGIPLIGGYSMPGWGYATYPKPFGYVGANRPPVNTYGTGEYVELTDIIGQVTDQDIYDVVSRTMPAGTTAWTAIATEFQEQPPTGGGAMLDTNFFLDMSVLAATTPPAVAALGAGRIIIFASGHIQEQATLLGFAKLPSFRIANALITEAPPLDINGQWMLPSIAVMGAMTGLPSKITLSVTMPPVIIYTTAVQPRLPAGLPFILGTIPNAQPLIGVSFILGQNAPGEIGGVAITQASSVCQIGSLAVSIPPQLTSVVSGAAAGSLFVGGVNLSISNPLPAVSSACIAGHLGSQGQLTLPTNLPFILGSTTGTGASAIFGVSGVTTNGIAGYIQFPLHVLGVNSSLAAAPLSVTSSHTIQAFSGTRKTSTITLSNGNLTATQTANSSDDAVYGVNTATSGKFYWEITTTYASAATIFAGIGNLSAASTAGAYVGSSLNSLGWDAADGTIKVNGATITTWAPWTSTANPTAPTGVSNTGLTSGSLTYTWNAAQDVTTVSFALDATNGLLWGRVNGGSWFGGSAGADPSAGTNGLAISSSVLASALAPGVTLDTSGDSATANFATASWVYTPPSGFGIW